jgi:hypothetical protein
MRQAIGGTAMTSTTNAEEPAPLPCERTEEIRLAERGVSSEEKQHWGLDSRIRADDSSLAAESISKRASINFSVI